MRIQEVGEGVLWRLAVSVYSDVQITMLTDRDVLNK